MRHLNNTYRIILDILSDGKYHSGQEIGEIVHLSRTSIGKYIQKLNVLGLDIYKVKGRGYCLPQPIELLDYDLITKETYPSQIKLFDIIDSTNAYMLTYIDSFSKGNCILAECQTKGVGRNGVKWISPFGCQIILSMYWEYDIKTNLSGLSLIIGLATIKILEKFGYKDIGLKWPNDIFCQQKKLAGILIDVKTILNKTYKIVIGVGLNVYNSHSLYKQDFQSISLDSIPNPKPINRNQIVVQLINEYKKQLENFEKNGFEQFKDQWNKYDIFRNKEVKITNKQNKEIITTGKNCGVNELGSIVIENQKGVKESFLIGDISLRTNQP